MSERIREEGILICDCDGVLIDSEAIAADVLVRELEARWPGADTRSAVLPLLGLQIPRVLSGTCDALGRTLSEADAAAIERAVLAEAVNAPAVDGIDSALAEVPLTIACASNSRRVYVEAVLSRTGSSASSASGCSARTASRARSPRRTSIWRRRTRSG